MSEIEPQPPLHVLTLAAKARPMDGTAGVWANELPLHGYISLRGRSGDEAFVAAVAAVLGMATPAKPCTLARNGAITVLWLSPDEWMIVCPYEDRSRLLAGLAEALKDIRSQVADNSGGFTGIAIRGRHAADVLAHASVYDMAKLAPDRVVGTTFGKSSVYVHPAPEGYVLLVRRSFADYVWRFLVRAAEPYGFGVVRLEAGA